MNTEPQGWDRNLRLGTGFWLTLAIACPVVWFAIWKWLYDLPLLSRVASAIVLPFLAAVAVYTFFQVIKERASRRQIRALFVTMVLIFACGAIAYFLGLGSDFFPAGLIICCAIAVYNVTSRKS